MVEIFKQGNPIVEPVPVFKESGPSKELLNGSRAGLHGALLRDALRPGIGVTLNKEELQKVKGKIDDGQSFETIKITNGSKHERDQFWKNSEYKDKSFEDQKNTWIGKTNDFLNYYYDGSVEKDGVREVLKNLGMDKDGAGEVYNEYFGKENGKGEVGYFASKVANKLSYEQIRDNADLLAKIGGFYGQDSAEVARLLAEGAKNLKENSDTFISAAEEGFNNLTDEDKKILDGVHERSGRWEVKEKQKEDARKAAEEKKRQEEEAARKKKENEKKTPVIRSLEKDKDGVEDAYNIVANQDTEKIKEEWKGHQKLTVSALNEPVVIDEEVIRDYNELVAQYAIKENKEVPFFFVEDTENKRIVKIFAGEAISYGLTSLSPLTAKAKNGEIFADWWNGESNKKNLFNGKDGKFKVGMGHTHPKGYGPIFSNAGGGDFGLDYSSEFGFRSSALFDANPCASNISFVGSPEMGLISAFEAKPEGVITYHPISVSETETSTQ